MPVKYRLGIDVGTNSLGWCLLRLNEAGEPYGILDIGVRIFKDARDPKSRASLAATRRTARAMRTQRDRRLGRMRRLMDALIRHGLMPHDGAERKQLQNDRIKCDHRAPDPYELRSRGLDEKLTPYEFGRALFHLARRRGFQSNLKADRKEKSGTTKEARDKLIEAMGGYRTLGEFLFNCGVGTATRALGGQRVSQHRLVRFRPHAKGAKVEYDLYPTRSMYAHEFTLLWQRQVELGNPLTDAAREEVRDAIFYQRPLKPVPVGKCTFEPSDPGRRAPEALPIAQRFRILQELNNLEWIDRYRQSHRLTPEQRTKILRLLERQKSVSFAKMRKILDLGSDVRFNLESEKRKQLDGDKVSYELGAKTRFGEQWWNKTLEDKNTIVELWLEEEDDSRLRKFAIENWKLTEQQAESVIEAPLPDHHFRVGRIAIRKMLPSLEAGLRYHDAAKAAGYDHAKLPSGENFDELPYYGERLADYTAEVPSASDPDERRFGRLANPTVHVALNQLRKLVNELIKRFGHPHEIVVELARDLPLGQEELRERESEQRNNQDRNEKSRNEIERLLREAGSTELEIQSALGRGDAVLRMRLWAELGKPPDRRCPYTLEQIGVRRLFSHEVHVDHILPFRRTHDDSYANKILCLRRANDRKRNFTPWEAFHSNPAEYDWEAILLQSTNLPKNKRWRFAEDAMQKFKRLDRFGIPKELADQFTEQDDFLASHLIDTRYLARVTREYLTAICHPYRVWPITGGTTAMLRGKWNLSALLPSHNVQAKADGRPIRKSRIDHRHHAIDAFVVACTTRSMLHRIASAADVQRDRLIEKMPEPWDGFSRDELRDALREIIVSIRPDHGTTGIDPATGRARTTGGLHNDTAYFPLSEPDRDGTSLVVSRKSIAQFESMEEIEQVPDLPLRIALRAFVSQQVANGEKIKESCVAFTEQTGIRKVRIRERLKVIPIRDREGRIYKAYKGDSNDFMEVWRMPDGQWIGQIVSTFDANQTISNLRARPHPAAKLLMRIRNDDMIRLIDGQGELRTMRIVKMSKQTVVMADHHESGSLKKRDADKLDSFKYFSKSVSSLRSLEFRKLHVTPSGRVHDPGPPK